MAQVALEESLLVDATPKFTYSKLVAQSACARLSDRVVNAENPQV